VAGGEDDDACCFGCGEGVGPAPAEYDANCSTPSALSATTQSAWPTGTSFVPAGIKILAKTLQGQGNPGSAIQKHTSLGSVQSQFNSKRS
jgi:hypothetical protein